MNSGAPFHLASALRNGVHLTNVLAYMERRGSCLRFARIVNATTRASFQDERIVNGRTRRLLGCLLLILASGCDDAPHTEVPKAKPLALAEAFDPATTGAITGEVVWSGEVPQVPTYHAPINPSGTAAIGQRHERANPYAPVVDWIGRVAGAVVFLREVDAKHSRPWDLPPVGVEMSDYNFRVIQGDATSRIGFVRRGASVEFVSRQTAFHAVRVRGSAFFTLAFPDADRPLRRVFDRQGVVELSSAAGYYWARANLFVAEHPYYTRTDDTGRFSLRQVPPGEYELVCWLPNWQEKEHELDGDSWQVSRLTFKAPIEIQQKVRVLSGQLTSAQFRLKKD